MATQHVRAACRKALKDYLAARTGLTGVTWSDQWPTAGVRLPSKAGTVLLAPGESREHKFQAVALSQTAISGDSVNALTLWSIGIVEFPIQIDLWCEFDEDRDTLSLTLEQALNRPAIATLRNELASRIDHAPNLVLEVADNFNTPAHYRFRVLADLPESNIVAQTGEFRATWIGSCTAHLLRQTTTPRINRMVLNQSGSGIVGTSAYRLYP